MIIKTVSKEEFLFALAEAFEDFSEESLKAEQVECIRGIICLREDALDVLPTCFGKSLTTELDHPEGVLV